MARVPGGQGCPRTAAGAGLPEESDRNTSLLKPREDTQTQLNLK